MTLTAISRTDYGVLDADPRNRPEEGDKYYNSKLRMEMIYDSHFKKWLSVETMTCWFGRNGNTPPETFYRGVNGITAEYIMPYDGTVTGVGFCRYDNDSCILEIVDDTTSESIAALDISTFTQGHFVDSFKKNFEKGSILRIKNAGPDATSNVQGWFKVRWLSKDRPCSCDAAVLIKKGCQCGGS